MNLRPAAAAVLALLLSVPARAQVGELRPIQERMGLPATDANIPAVPPAKGVPVGDDGTPLTPAEQRTNFSYGDITNRLKKTIIGHGRRKRPANNGVTVADRVDRGEIRYVVVHSAMGTCRGAIDTMERHHAAAHFIVCADGSVTRLVDIKNITLHVKNKDINDASVGIETETGWDGSAERFTDADWDPDARWRMYASLAWLIRAVADEAHVPRDGSHIIGHLDADQGIPDAHTDPGPLFYNKVYPTFEARFPGMNVTPQKFLMLLVGDDTPPTIVRRRTSTSSLLRVSEPNQSGVARVKIFNLNTLKPAAMRTWEAPPGELPPAHVDLPEPEEPGPYRVEAYDLVGNLTAAVFTVEAAGGAPVVAFGDTLVQPLKRVE